MLDTDCLLPELALTSRVRKLLEGHPRAYALRFGGLSSIDLVDYIREQFATTGLPHEQSAGRFKLDREARLTRKRSERVARLSKSARIELYRAHIRAQASRTRKTSSWEPIPYFGK